MSRPFKFVLAPLMALALILAGCGDEAGSAQNGGSGGNSSTDDPNAAILAAFSNIDATGMDLTVSIDATGAELAAAMEGEMTGDPADQAVLDLLARGEIHMSSTTEGDMAMAVSVDGSVAMELRSIDEVFYIRVDTATLVDLIGSIDPASAAEMNASLAELPMMLGSDPSMSFLGDLLDGGWVSLDLPPDSPLGSLAGPAQDPEQFDAELAEVISQIVDENSKVTEAGEARGGDRYLVEVRMADLMSALATHPATAEALELTASDADLDEILADMEAEGVSEVWELDVVLIDGQLSSIRVDFANLTTDMPEGSTFPLLITLSGSPSAPSAPAEHTPVPPEMLELLMSGMIAGV